jgi:hypothetical protein
MEGGRQEFKFLHGNKEADNCELWLAAKFLDKVRDKTKIALLPITTALF